jgi:hypothetical protein
MQHLTPLQPPTPGVPSVSLVALVFACSACTGSLSNDADGGQTVPRDGGAGTARDDASAQGAAFDSGEGAGTPDDAAAPNDAEPTDAQSSADSGRLDASSGSCAGRGYALCEDFEGTFATALPSGWSVTYAEPGASTPHVVEAQHKSGARALETALGTAGQARARRSLAELGPLAAQHWGRVWYKSEGPLPPPTADVLHNTIVGLEGSVESRVVDTVVQPSGQHQFLYNVPDDSVGIGTDYRYASYDGQWHCAEWYVDASTQTYRFFFDGTEASFKQGTGQRPKLEEFASIALGFICYRPASTPYRGWLDDLAIDDERIGCE